MLILKIKRNSKKLFFVQHCDRGKTERCETKITIANTCFINFLLFKKNNSKILLGKKIKTIENEQVVSLWFFRLERFFKKIIIIKSYEERK